MGDRMDFEKLSHVQDSDGSNENFIIFLDSRSFLLSLKIYFKKKYWRTFNH